MPPKSSKKSSVLRVGAYARASTHDQQTLPLQKRKIHEYAKSRGLQLVHERQEVGSGAKLRPMREELMRAARRREIRHYRELFFPLARSFTTGGKCSPSLT